jgi:hypothetical protein
MKIVHLKFTPLVLLALVGCGPSLFTNPDGTFGQRGGSAWYSGSAPDQKEAFFREQCYRFGLTDRSPKMKTCKDELDLGFLLRREEVVLCPLSEREVDKGLTCVENNQTYRMAMPMPRRNIAYTYK